MLKAEIEFWCGVACLHVKTVLTNKDDSRYSDSEALAFYFISIKQTFGHKTTFKAAKLLIKILSPVNFRLRDSRGQHITTVNANYC